MPVVAGDRRSRPPHRPHIRLHVHIVQDACVARPVGKREVQANQKAQESLDVERCRLSEKGVWDEAHPREWNDVRREASDKGESIHIGCMFDFCVEEFRDGSREAEV